MEPGQHTFYHSRQPRLPLELSHWLRAVEYLRCYPRVLNLGYLFSTRPESRLSVFKYSVFTTFQISNTEERGQTAFITPLLSCSVPGNICNRDYTQGLPQKSKTAWINNQAHMYVYLQNGADGRPP